MLDYLLYAVSAIWSIFILWRLAKGIWRDLLRPHVENFQMWWMINRSRKVDKFIARIGPAKQRSPIEGIIEKRRSPTGG
jgi:hypothetical protein